MLDITSASSTPVQSMEIILPSRSSSSTQPVSMLPAVTAKGKLPCKTKKTAIKSCLPCGAGMQSKSEPFSFDVTLQKSRSAYLLYS